jgi:hypothetical protein
LTSLIIFSLIASISVGTYRLGESVKRSYSKIQDILTKFGGLAKSLMMIASFLVTYTSKVEYQLDFVANLRTRYENSKNILVSAISSEISPIHSKKANNYLDKKAPTINLKQINNSTPKNRQYKPVNIVPTKIKESWNISECISGLLCFIRNQTMKKQHLMLERRLNSCTSIEKISYNSFLLDYLHNSNKASKEENHQLELSYIEYMGYHDSTERTVS